MEGVWGVERAVWECVCVLFQPPRSLPEVRLPGLVSFESKGHILEGEEKDEPTFFWEGGWSVAIQGTVTLGSEGSWGS